MIYEYWLAGIKEISDRKKRILRETYRSGKAIYYIYTILCAGISRKT